MRQFSILLIAILASGCTKAEPLTDTPEGETATITYASGICAADGLTLPYRYSEISASDKVDPCIVLVLHGGPLKGSDNEKQLQETALIKVAGYLSEKMIPSVLIVPHCPDRNAQGRLANWVQFAPVLAELVGQFRGDSSSPAYIFGASIGGVGTWNMLSSYPGLFKGAMPCAASPEGCDPGAVALTRIYTVMGTEDTWAPIEKSGMQEFLDRVKEAGGDCRYDVGEGWDHETTCMNCITKERLDWVFGK